LLDFENYHQWNTFTPEATFPAAIKESRAPRVGDHGTVVAHLASPEAAARPTNVEITTINEEHFRVTWKATEFPSWSLRGERVQELIEVEPENGKERCEFRNYETQAGPLRWAVKAAVGDTLDHAMQRCADDLKRFMEAANSTPESTVEATSTLAA
jgi:hypothetical protein